MGLETLVYDKYGTDNRIGRITLNRPEKLNTLSPKLLSELREVLTEAASDSSVRVIVIRGSGRGFGAGYDLGGGGGDRKPVFPGEEGFVGPRRWDFQTGARLQMFLFNLPKVTIAQVHGYCLAGSCEYAMMCDLIVAAEDAVIGHPGIRGLGHPRNSCIWPMVIGMRKSKELMYTGDSISGTEAERIGMINRAVPADQLEDEVTRLAERIANQSADSLAVHKEALNRWWQAMGMEASVMSAAEYDLIYQLTDSAIELRRKIAELGLREAFRWRDGRYGDLSGEKGDK
ncbi:MAG: enoyl-CoA hydratase/isomerase family protein [Deltaproteobacteria bacterium]|nr:enoyl-CoA hydratase/isomerase family protein [Deltaproteobacteria bacterium]